MVEWYVISINTQASWVLLLSPSEALAFYVQQKTNKIYDFQQLVRQWSAI